MRRLDDVPRLDSRGDSRHVPRGLLTVGRIRPGGNQPVDTTAKVTNVSRPSSHRLRPVQFWRGFFPLVVRVWTSATGRLTVLVVVIAGRVPLLPSVAV